eukprot:7509678-Pyramimonas_sp.AAC.1
MATAWREVEEAEDLAQKLGELRSDDSQQMIYVAVERAAAGLARRPLEWPQHLKTRRQRQGMHAH